MVNHQIFTTIWENIFGALFRGIVAGHANPTEVKMRFVFFSSFTLEVQRLFFEWFFRKDYCFSRDLQSTIQGDYSFYGL